MTVTTLDSATGERIEVRLGAATPAEIDTALYALYVKDIRALNDLLVAYNSLHHTAGDKHDYYRKTWGLTDREAYSRVVEIASSDNTYVGAAARKAIAKVDDLKGDRVSLAAQMEPLNEEFVRRGGWTRAFLVTDGHVHSSRECSTCFITTQFTWLTQFSGHDEAEIVEAAAERACTVCYPSAPTLRSFEKASPLFTEEEAERNKAREVRAVEKEARLAKKIEKALTADGSEFEVRYDEPGRKYNRETQGWEPAIRSRTEHFKTEQAAVQWAVAKLADLISYQYAVSEGAHEAISQIKQAVASKHGITAEAVEEIFAKKIAAKVKRDSR